MAENLSSHEQAEEAFRRKRHWTSFKAQSFTALSMATFIGMLGKLVGSAVEMAGTGEGAVAAASFFTNPMALAVAGVALAAGVAFTYMAQNEWTDLKVMEDDHLAKRNAECNALEKAKAKAAELAATTPCYEQNCRADGKPPWQDVVKSDSRVIAR